MGRPEVLDPQIQMDLLRRHAMRPIGSNMIWRKLHTYAGFAVDQDHVPVAIPVDLTAKHSRPERALSVEVRCVERHDLPADPHAASLGYVVNECVRSQADR